MSSSFSGPRAPTSSRVTSGITVNPSFLHNGSTLSSAFVKSSLVIMALLISYSVALFSFLTTACSAASLTSPTRSAATKPAVAELISASCPFTSVFMGANNFLRMSVRASSLGLSIVIYLSKRPALFRSMSTLSGADVDPMKNTSSSSILSSCDVSNVRADDCFLLSFVHIS